MTDAGPGLTLMFLKIEKSVNWSFKKATIFTDYTNCPLNLLQLVVTPLSELKLF